MISSSRAGKESVGRTSSGESVLSSSFASLSSGRRQKQDYQKKKAEDRRIFGARRPLFSILVRAFNPRDKESLESYGHAISVNEVRYGPKVDSLSFSHQVRNGWSVGGQLFPSRRRPGASWLWRFKREGSLSMKRCFTKPQAERVGRGDELYVNFAHYDVYRYNKLKSIKEPVYQRSYEYAMVVADLDVPGKGTPTARPYFDGVGSFDEVYRDLCRKFEGIGLVIRSRSGGIKLFFLMEQNDLTSRQERLACVMYLLGDAGLFQHLDNSTSGLTTHLFNEASLAEFLERRDALPNLGSISGMAVKGREWLGALLESGILDGRPMALALDALGVAGSGTHDSVSGAAGWDLARMRPTLGSGVVLGSEAVFGGSAGASALTGYETDVRTGEAPFKAPADSCAVTRPKAISGIGPSRYSLLPPRVGVNGVLTYSSCVADLRSDSAQMVRLEGASRDESSRVYGASALMELQKSEHFRKVLQALVAVPNLSCASSERREEDAFDIDEGDRSEPLMAVSEAGGFINQKRLAATAGVSLETVNRFIDSLKSKGLLECSDSRYRAGHYSKRYRCLGALRALCDRVSRRAAGRGKSASIAQVLRTRVIPDGQWNKTLRSLAWYFRQSKSGFMTFLDSVQGFDDPKKDRRLMANRVFKWMEKSLMLRRRVIAAAVARAADSRVAAKVLPGLGGSQGITSPP